MFRTTGTSHDAGASAPDGGTASPDATVVSFRPTLDLRWQIQLVGSIDTAVESDMFDIDLSAETAIQTLREQSRAIICDFSAGTLESWRDDARSIPAEAVGNPVADYPEENWLDFRDATVRQVMAARMDQAAARGCAGIRPESLDGVLSNTGFSLTRQDQIDYDRQIARMAHARGLSVGFTGGDAELAVALEPDFDWALALDCVSRGDCSEVRPFSATGKVVFLVAYGDASNAQSACAQAAGLGFDTIVKNRSLDAFVIGCR